MILSSLVDCYEELVNENKVPMKGWSREKVSNALEIDEDGNLINIYSLSETDGKKTKPQTMVVPQTGSRSSNIFPYLLSDTPEYLLGFALDGNGNIAVNDKTLDKFNASKNKHLEFLVQNTSATGQALYRFFLNWDPTKNSENEFLQKYLKDLSKNSRLVFIYKGEYIQKNQEIRDLYNASLDEQNNDKQICLVTGKEDVISRKHFPIKGIPGAQSSGALVVSFNSDAFCSFGKSQGENAPVGEKAAFAYATALNYLISDPHSHRMLGDTMIVFWGRKELDLLNELFFCTNDPDNNVDLIEGVFDCLSKGKNVSYKNVNLDLNQPFSVAGLTPNAARISISFYVEQKFGILLNNLKKHYERMEIIKPSFVKNKYLSPYGMLLETTLKPKPGSGSTPKIKKNLPPELMRAIITDSRYPESLFANLLIRIRAEQGDITWKKASMIKAYLIKNKGLKEEEKYVSLNVDSENKAYQIGRLFAFMELAQRSASSAPLNVTIRDRYIVSAAATPAVIFPGILKTYNAHLKKIRGDKPGLAVRIDKDVQSVMDKIDEFPKTISNEDQMAFYLGYYHQTQECYKPKNKTDEKEMNGGEENVSN